MGKQINIGNAIISFSIFLIFILEAQMFFLAKSDHIYKLNNTYQKILIISVIFLVCVIFANYFLSKGFIFNKFIFCFLVFLFIEIIISVYRYGLKLTSVFSISNYLLIILAYYIFSYYMKKNEKEKLVRIVMYFTLICSTLLLLQYILFPNLGFFLNIDHYAFRFATIRITQAEGLINIGIVLAFGVIINSNLKFKLLPYLTFFVGIFELILVQKTRMALFCVVLSCLLVYLANSVKKLGRLFTLAIFLFVLVGVLQSNPLINQYTESLTSDDVSYRVRNEATSYFIDQFGENKLFGIGIIPPGASSYTDNILYGPEGKYFKSDIGIIGFMSTYGLVGLCWLVLIFVKIISILFKSFRLKTFRDNNEIVSLTVFLLLSSWTLIVMDPQRIIALPLLLALIDYLYHFNEKFRREISGEISG